MLIDGAITPEKLPTSEKAICYHGFRLHLQIIKWKMLDEPQSLNATDWGWKKYGGYLVPIPTDKDVAPTNILKVIKCRCNSTSKNKCGTTQWTHLRRFAIDSTSKFHVESSWKLHRF